MTDREKAIVMAHTGICMLAGEKFGVFHAYIEDIMGRPVYTHELAIQSISDEIKEKSRDDFIKLCKEEQEPCEDAISRSEVIKSIDEKEDVNGKVDAESVRTDIVLMHSVKPQESCKDAINRAKALEAIRKLPHTGWLISTESVLNILSELPPVNTQAKTGHWVYKIYGGFHEQGNWHCSHCDYQYNYGNGHAKFCPECGYEMSEPPTEEVIRDKDYDWIIKR